MEIPPGTLDPETEERLRRALAGSDEAVRLRLGEARPGDVGVLDVVVRQVHPTRPYARKRGGTGLLGRVILADASGEADLVLWDDATRVLQDGPFQPGAALRLHGAGLRPGRRGGIEVGLGAALVVPREEAAGPPQALAGTLLAIGPTRVVGAPPRIRFQADVQVGVVGGVARIVVEGEAVRTLREVLPGAEVRFEGVAPHPLLDGWWLAGPGAAVVR